MNSKYFRIATYRKLLPTYTTQSEYNSHQRSSESSFRFCRIKAYSWSPVDRSLLLSVWGVMLHATKTWAVIVDINRLVKNDNVMVRWIWPSKIMHKRHMADLNKHLGISSLEIILRRGRWRWFGQVKRMDGNLWQQRMLYFDVKGKYCGRSRKQWLDLHTPNITEHLVNDRNA